MFRRLECFLRFLGMCKTLSDRDERGFMWMIYGYVGQSITFSSVECELAWRECVVSKFQLLV